MNFLKNMDDSRRFNLVSWGVTALLVIVMLGITFWQVQSRPVAMRPIPTAEPTIAAQVSSSVSMPALDSSSEVAAISRHVTLKTTIPERPVYDVNQHTVVRGDSVFGIAKEFNITPDTLLWANYETLNDSPDSLRPGQVLNVPPTNGVYYQLEEGDTIEGVAAKFKASPDDILNWPGNHLDLTDPEVKAGDFLMVPGGRREYKQWLIPTVARGRSGTANVGGSSSCGGGAVGSSAFIWPAANHYLSGNDYYAGHLGIDIAAGEGAPVYASDAGVVTMASSGWNYGYGNVIQIDHGNGYSTLYAHLSQINVGVCQSVSTGSLIGLAGNTGNSFGAHLHFEVRQSGGFINPWYVLP